jgi:CRISPR/Cas system-associated exonuclease Cas4 (RecB family)
MNTRENDIKNDSPEPKKRSIPLHKAYIWGIVFCITAIIAITLYNSLKTPPETEPAGDYLKLLRDSHAESVAGQGLLTDREKRIGKLEEKLEEKTGIKITFPDWFGKVPNIELKGTRAKRIDDNWVVFLVFSVDNDNSRLIDYVTILGKRDEIDQFESVELGEEKHPFHVNKWKKNTAYFWDIEQDNQAITYGLISYIDQAEIETYALEIMRSLKTMYEQ